MSTTSPLPRIGLTTILVLAFGLVALIATPARAGEVVCSLQATVGGGSATEVPVGEEVLIEGFGFPTGDVEVSFSSEGTFLRSVTATADATGFFEITDTPQPGEEGLWTVEAVAMDEICTATTGYLVVGVPATPSPSVAASVEASPAPTASAVPDVAVPATRGAGSSPLLALAGFALLLVAGSMRLATARRR